MKLTRDDLQDLRTQKQMVLRMLIDAFRGLPDNGWVSVDRLSMYSGSTRVAALIHELRDQYEIEGRRPSNNSRLYEYRVLRERTTPRIKKPHCETCTCVNGGKSVVKSSKQKNNNNDTERGLENIEKDNNSEQATFFSQRDFRDTRHIH